MDIDVTFDKQDYRPLICLSSSGSCPFLITAYSQNLREYESNNQTSGIRESLCVIALSGRYMGMFYNERIDISMEKWCELLSDKSVTTDKDIRVLKFIYEAPKHEASASEIALYLGLPHYGPLHLQIWRFSERVVQKTGITSPIRNDGSTRWWHIPFLGYDDEKAGRFPWIMRPELVLAFEEVHGTMEDDGEHEFTLLDQDLFQDLPLLSEGEKKSSLINRYERNRRARILCLKHYGYSCVICEFNFEKAYGPIGKNKIHIHHTNPIAKIGHDYIVDPVQDLRPVCPNCHTVIHSKRDPFTIKEVKAILDGQRNDA